MKVQEQAIEVRSFWDVLRPLHEETPAARRCWAMAFVFMGG